MKKVLLSFLILGLFLALSNGVQASDQKVLKIQQDVMQLNLKKFSLAKENIGFQQQMIQLNQMKTEKNKKEIAKKMRVFQKEIKKNIIDIKKINTQISEKIKELKALTPVPTEDDADPSEGLETE